MTLFRRFPRGLGTLLVRRFLLNTAAISCDLQMEKLLHPHFPAYKSGFKKKKKTIFVITQVIDPQTVLIVNLNYPLQLRPY